MPWLKWNDGETKDIFVLEDHCHQNVVHWVRGRGIDCHGPGCRLCDLGDRPSVRWATEVMCDGQQYTWEMSNTVHNQLMAAAQVLGGLLGLHLTVTRSGTGLDTQYTLVPIERDETVEPATPAAGGSTTPQAVHHAATNNDRLRAQIARDPQGAAAYAKELCATLELEPKEALQDFLNADGRAYANADAITQLAAFTKHLEQQVNRAKREAQELRLNLDELLG